MRKITVLCLIATLLLSSGCQPSEAAVQKAIAQTQTAAPTATVTASPTITPSPVPPTKTPTPTRTTAPTKTSTITPSPTPFILLRTLLITNKDLGPFAELYTDSPIIMDTTVSTDVYLQHAEVTFIYKGDFDPGAVTMTVYQYVDSNTPAEINDGLKYAMNIYPTTFKVDIPDNFWVGEDKLSTAVWASATYRNFLIQFNMETVPYIENSTKASMALLLVKNQIAKLQEVYY